jgi:hypothetical protein
MQVHWHAGHQYHRAGQGRLGLLIILTLRCPEISMVYIVIGGLKSRGRTKTYIMCTEKISPVKILTIPGLSMLRDDQKSLTAYLNYRLALFVASPSFRPAKS